MAEMEDVTTATDQQTASTHVSYRRNGKLFSCEPCRKGKLRCDHVSPTCGRCAKRGKADQCIYHPAPLTKQHRPSDAENRRQSSTDQHRFSPYPQSKTFSNSTPTNSSTVNQSTFKPIPVSNGLVSPSLSSEEQPRRDQIGPMANPDIRRIQNSTKISPVIPYVPVLEDPPTISSHSATITSPDSSMSIRDPRHGFLGATAYSAVLAENESMEFDDHIDDLPPTSMDKIQQGAEILTLLRDMPTYRKLTRKWFDVYDGLIILQPTFRIWFDDFWNEWGAILTEGNPTQLLRMSELIFKNTRKPLKTHGTMTAVEWSKAATGRNIRWEVIGMILSLIGLVSVNMNDWEAGLDELGEPFLDLDRSTFAERMRRFSERCLCFCYVCEVLNDIYVCFMYQDLVLVECMKGESHYAAWQRTGELLDALVASGLHQGNNVNAETPFFLSQLRRKLFTLSYSRDKTMASYLGRPPRLSKRYCKLEMPLDLSDDELFLEGPALEEVLSALDANGWNTAGRLHRRTWTRVWFQECLIREEILEIALGSGDDDIHEGERVIRAKLDQLHSSFPACMQITPEEVLEPDNPKVAAVFGRHRISRVNRQLNVLYLVCIKAGMMLTEFLLQRAVVNRCRRDTRTLIPISRKMLKTVLLAQARRDQLGDFRLDLVYLLLYYGLPSASVLAIELLKQEQSRTPSTDQLPKSETIQDLSVYISALSSVAPGEGNYDICNQGRRALTKVLDQILAPSAPVAASHDTPAFDDMSLYFPTANDADFLEWLDNVAWDKTLAPASQDRSGA